MNPTKTTLCMLLAAALGSAATATALWRIRPTDPLSSYLQATKESFKQEKTRYGKYASSYHLPDKPLPLAIGDICVQKKEEVWDAYVQSVGPDAFHFENIDGLMVAYTTAATMDLYHTAMSHLSQAPSHSLPAGERAKRVINETMRPTYGSAPRYLSDGTPIIDWKRASAVLSTLASQNHSQENVMAGIPPGLQIHDEVYLPDRKSFLGTNSPGKVTP